MKFSERLAKVPCKTTIEFICLKKVLMTSWEVHDFQKSDTANHQDIVTSSFAFV